MQVVSTQAAGSGSKAGMARDRRFFYGLLHRRVSTLPTWRGWLLAFALAAIAGFIGVRTVHVFLAPTHSVPGGVLVVEGWLPDYCLEEAVAESRRNHYDALFVTGGLIGPIVPGPRFTYADLGATKLEKLGATTPAPQAVPSQDAYRDRTYMSAITLRDWLKAHQLHPTKVNLVSIGPHSRRSRLLFEEALGPDVEVGIIAAKDLRYDERHWWRSSEGFRSVVDELVAYAYARIVFSPAQ